MNFSKDQNIYLVGFMGSGKSTVGFALARKLNRRFIDTDDWIEKEVGKKITRIFADDGEHFFRQKEKGVIDKVANEKGYVVALGGGAVIDAGNWTKINSSGMTIYLKYPPTALYQRVKNDNSRPLLLGAGHDKLLKIESLLKQREPLYHRCDLIVNLELNRSVGSIVDEIITKLESVS